MSRACLRNKSVGRQVDQRRIPAGEKTATPLEAECKQTLLGGEAMVVEGMNAVGHIDMVAGESGRGFDPPGMETEVRVTFKEGKSYNI